MAVRVECFFLKLCWQWEKSSAAWMDRVQFVFARADQHQLRRSPPYAPKHAFSIRSSRGWLSTINFSMSVGVASDPEGLLFFIRVGILTSKTVLLLPIPLSFQIRSLNPLPMSWSPYLGRALSSRAPCSCGSQQWELSLQLCTMLNLLQFPASFEHAELSFCASGQYAWLVWSCPSTSTHGDGHYRIYSVALMSHMNSESALW